MLRALALPTGLGVRVHRLEDQVETAERPRPPPGRSPPDPRGCAAAARGPLVASLACSWASVCWSLVRWLSRKALNALTTDPITTLRSDRTTSTSTRVKPALGGDPAHGALHRPERSRLGVVLIDRRHPVLAAGAGLAVVLVAQPRAVLGSAQPVRDVRSTSIDAVEADVVPAVAGAGGRRGLPVEPQVSESTREASSLGLVGLVGRGDHRPRRPTARPRAGSRCPARDRAPRRSRPRRRRRGGWRRRTRSFRARRRGRSRAPPRS